jgi:hypothetical protein
LCRTPEGPVHGQVGDNDDSVSFLLDGRVCNRMCGDLVLPQSPRPCWLGNLVYCRHATFRRPHHGTKVPASRGARGIRRGGIAPTPHRPRLLPHPPFSAGNSNTSTPTRPRFARPPAGHAMVAILRPGSGGGPTVQASNTHGTSYACRALARVVLAPARACRHSRAMGPWGHGAKPLNRKGMGGFDGRGVRAKRDYCEVTEGCQCVSLTTPL